MSMAIANPEELRNFANTLQKYLENIEEETGVLTSAFSSLGDTWQDQQKNKFEEILKELLAVLKRFEEDASEQIPHLLKMAEDLETYLGR
jgi:hypothetical protein|uniref:WXG100 family type VII secretion target n=1 Tax=Fusobacterium nucleatum TaxID=851 RepID=UPI00356391E7